MEDNIEIFWPGSLFYMKLPANTLVCWQYHGVIISRPRFDARHG